MTQSTFPPNGAASPDSEINSEALWARLAQLQWLLHLQQIGTRRHRGPLADTSKGQGRILAALKMRDGLSTKELAFLLGMQVSSLNEALGRLVRAGYVTRVASPDDKRVQLVHLTEQGKAHSQDEDVQNVDPFANLTEPEQANLANYLDRIIENLQQHIGDDDMWEQLKAHRQQMAQRMGIDPEMTPFGPGFGGRPGGFPGFPGFGGPGGFGGFDPRNVDPRNFGGREGRRFGGRNGNR